MRTAIVSGALANKPFNGGNAWTRLSWALGLKRLGFDVYFVEEITAETCMDATGSATTFENSINLAYFRETMKQFGLDSRSALICQPARQTDGLAYAQLVKLAAGADLLFNISGHLREPSLKHGPRCKVFFDDDPGFTQFWYASCDYGPVLDGHDFYFTIGENIGTPVCRIPSGKIIWHTTRPPVVLDDWPVCTEGASDRFTTVSSWRGPYGPVTYAGQTYGLKLHEFRKFVAMPQRARQTFEIALNIHPADQRDRDALQHHGWRIVEPKKVAGTPDQFRRYVQTSGAEFSVAQGLYVDTKSGWFSDRTVRYLASGKPVLVQDTGFSRNYPVGEGLLAFLTVDEALAGAERLARDYRQHCLAARAVAEACFDSDKVIGKLLNQVNLSS